jgi:hypothetical protein
MCGATSETRPIAQHGARVVLHHKPLVRHQPGAARDGAERAHAVSLLVHLQREEREVSRGAARVYEEAPCPRSETRPKRTSKIFSVKVLCVHFGSRHCSSSSAKRPTGAVDEPPARACRGGGVSE